MFIKLQWKTVFENGKPKCEFKRIRPQYGGWYPKNLRYFSDVKAWNEAIEKNHAQYLTSLSISSFNSIKYVQQSNLTWPEPPIFPFPYGSMYILHISNSIEKSNHKKHSIIENFCKFDTKGKFLRSLQFIWRAWKSVECLKPNTFQLATST